MISRKKLSIYKRLNGDDDMFSYIGTEDEKQLIAPEDWSQIRLLITELGQLKAGLVSEEYAVRIREHLRQKVEADAIDDIVGMA
ncbi:MAG TPA: hypothetical protein VN915_17600 [Elusimicrobiota bacterium]|nr:hypothetical protein [Elusimicrobiota bacterium]